MLLLIVNIICLITSKHNLYNNLFKYLFSIGGVFLTALKSKIRVDNTLDKRIELIKQSSTPEIRKILFGK